MWQQRAKQTIYFTEEFLKITIKKNEKHLPRDLQPRLLNNKKKKHWEYLTF